MASLKSISTSAKSGYLGVVAPEAGKSSSSGSGSTSKQLAIAAQVEAQGAYNPVSSLKYQIAPANTITYVYQGQSYSTEESLKQAISQAINPLVTSQIGAAQQQYQTQEIESLKQRLTASETAIAEQLYTLSQNVATKDMLPQKKGILESISDFFTGGTEEVTKYALLAFGALIVYNMTKNKGGK